MNFNKQFDNFAYKIEISVFLINSYTVKMFFINHYFYLTNFISV